MVLSACLTIYSNFTRIQPRANYVTLMPLLSCFTESLLLDRLEELFVNPLPTIHYCYGVWQGGFRTMKEASVLHEGVPTTSHLQKWFSKRGFTHVR